MTIDGMIKKSKKQLNEPGPVVKPIWQSITQPELKRET
jgi:hypothetical protein